LVISTPKLSSTGVSDFGFAGFFAEVEDEEEPPDDLEKLSSSSASSSSNSDLASGFL